MGVLIGDGIGTEIVPAAVTVADAAGRREGVVIDWVELPFGLDAVSSHGSPIPEATLRALDDLDTWIVGPHDASNYPPAQRGSLTPGAVIRKRFDLFANLRPCQAFPGVPAMAPDIDVLIVRENSEGLYADRNMATGSGEFMPTPDVALAVGVVTRAASERIAREAFTAAMGRRRHVTVVHKANVLAMTTGLFRDVCLDVAAQFPDVVVDQQHVDAMAAHLVRRPADFDVIVTENLFGDILSDLAAELAGSLGLAGSVNASDRKAMAQAAHGAAPDIAGRGIANPVAMMASVAQTFRWWARSRDDGRFDAVGARIEAAMRTVLSAGVATVDLGGDRDTAAFTDAVLAAVNLT